VRRRRLFHGKQGSPPSNGIKTKPADSESAGCVYRDEYLELDFVVPVDRRGSTRCLVEIYQIPSLRPPDPPTCESREHSGLTTCLPLNLPLLLLSAKLDLSLGTRPNARAIIASRKWVRNYRRAFPSHLTRAGPNWPWPRNIIRPACS